MGGKNVKNTIVERAMQSLAPHYCYGCGKVGSVLCAYCKYDIVHEPFGGCFVCGTASRRGICESHGVPVQQAIVVSERSGVIEALINGLKFHNTKAVAKELAILLHERLPLFPEDTVIVPIPTVRSHIRQRGYDQVELIARHLATLRKMPVEHPLRRATNTTQHVVGKKIRQIQAAQAFSLASQSSLRGKRIVLLDDVVTTGSTLTAAAHLLVQAGVIVWVAAVAYQPLEKGATVQGWYNKNTAIGTPELH